MDPATMAMLAQTAFQVGSQLFGKKKTVTAQPMMPGFQLNAGQLLGDFIQQYLPQYQPGKEYPGEFTAPMTPFETLGLGKLSEYMNAPATGELFGAGKKELLDTLGGRYREASTSPLVQSLKGLADQNLSDMITQARGQAGARGKYFTSASIKGENALRERTQNYLNAIIGQSLENERGRQFSAINPALQYEEYGTQTAPLKQIAASQTFGALERTIEQADLERRYQDFGRQQQELGEVPGLALGLYSSSPNYGVPSVSKNQPNALLQALSGLDWGAIGKPGGSIWDIFKPTTTPVK